MLMNNDPALELPGELDVVNHVHALLEGDTRLGLEEAPLTVAFADGFLTLDGEVEDVALKKRVLRRAASVPGVRWLVDHVRVKPSTSMEDGEIRDHVRDALEDQVEFGDCRLVVAENGHERVVREPVAARGTIRVEVANGIVKLDGDVPSLSHRRLAGVLAWWIPGTRDVENGLGIVPPEADNDDEVTDAVRLALERDPLVDADQIGISTRDGRVRLRGMVTSEAQRRIAERDAWYVLGVDEVVNEIVARA